MANSQRNLCKRPMGHYTRRGNTMRLTGNKFLIFAMALLIAMTVLAYMAVKPSNADAAYVHIANCANALEGSPGDNDAYNWMVANGYRNYYVDRTSYYRYDYTHVLVGIDWSDALGRRY